ncbi:FkbM family methyltransferase [Chitinophaga nivalis]|uniref:FkbM family methyltransferase n=1 Tax=Chitinophaga nivalis TaxID=2991709 RepID=A0ABT3IEQ6_9BACT|nr:FkbM family methyltransferase [Chitinophaga nivalis]MCW3467876.1 FkbM family methyltransferase [Chitinophaga nivalis]MCW3482433.1 FkbM family methyltransferase [Chitinophaga nivalis]
MKKIEKMIRGCKYRLLLLYHYLFNKAARQRTHIREMIFHLFSPTMHAVAGQHATMVREDNDYKYYRITGYPDLFVYPQQAPYYSFAMILAEARPQHWHYYEIPETAVKPGDVIVDCGSAEGFFAFKHQYTAGHIFALEPLPVFIDALHQQFRQKNTVTILPVAAGDTCGTAYISMPGNDTILDAVIRPDNAAGDAVAVNIVTLDSLFAAKNINIDYLKADIEGFEENMIRGALETIRKSKPKIAITTYHKGQDYQALIDLVKGVVPEYNYLVKGIDYLSGNPVMLHMWI